MEDKLRVPKRVTIETIYSCNYKCVFCPHGDPEIVNDANSRKRSIMSMETYKGILDNLAPYNSEIEMLSPFGLGEPTIDPYIVERIKYAKELGYQGIGFATNAEKLNEELQRGLLESGIDTVIFSIDGYKKETHEKLRKGSTFENVVGNAESMIGIRDNEDYDTRFIARFVYQEANANEWDDYFNFWSKRLSKEKRDKIIKYPLHNWAGQTKDKGGILTNSEVDETIGLPCHHYTDMLYILSDGTVSLCHEDNPNPKYIFGNVNEKTPLEIFNSKKRLAFNRLHEKGEKENLERCNGCTILHCESKRQILEPGEDSLEAILS